LICRPRGVEQIRAAGNVAISPPGYSPLSPPLHASNTPSSPVTATACHPQQPEDQIAAVAPDGLAQTI